MLNINNHTSWLKLSFNLGLGQILGQFLLTCKLFVFGIGSLVSNPYLHQWTLHLRLIPTIHRGIRVCGGGGTHIIEIVVFDDVTITSEFCTCSPTFEKDLFI